MPKKKIMLFVVEGLTDETSLSTVLNRIFSSETIRFHVVHGDILTHDFPSPDRIVSAVYEQVKDFCGNVYRPSDICKIIHLTDTDGAFIPDEAVVENHDKSPEQYPYYTDYAILTPKPESIVIRNKTKRTNINKLSSVGSIGKIPYSFFYFSSNLDHVLHGKVNQTDKQKEGLADTFDSIYADNPNAFIRFMKGSPFSVKGTYGETWSFIKIGTRSLERYSNFGIFLPDNCDWCKIE